MESISSLRTTLLAALSASDRQEGVQELFDELAANKPRLLNVFQFGPRNPQEQREVESGMSHFLPNLFVRHCSLLYSIGKVAVDGRSLAVNSEFARQVAFISQQLNCSERFIAGILHSVLTENPTISHVEAVERTVLAYHQLRRELADCLQLVFEAAEKTEEAFSLPVHALLNDFVKRQLVMNTRESSIMPKFFSELHAFETTITNARTAVTNAISSTNIPGPQSKRRGLFAPVSL